MRDDFNESVKITLLKRVGNKCSAPDCRALTTGPNLDSTKSVNLGKAAHITAASPDGPRYDFSLTTEQRKHPDNGIWLCSTCADKVDKDEIKYPVSLLKNWKDAAENAASLAVGKTVSAVSYSQTELSQIEIRLLKVASTNGDIILFKVDGGHFFNHPSINLINMSHGERVEYIEALNSLTAKRLFSKQLPLTRTQGTVFELTSDGYKYLNNIAANENK